MIRAKPRTNFVRMHQYLKVNQKQDQSYTACLDYKDPGNNPLSTTRVICFLQHQSTNHMLSRALCEYKLKGVQYLSPRGFVKI